MPEFESDIQDKIVLLQGMQRLGTGVEVYEMVKVEWPSPDGTKYYGVMPVDEVSSVPPVNEDDVPIDCELRLIPASEPDWFLPITIDSSIGDEDVTLEMWDGDEVISQLAEDHGEGLRTTVYYWFPQVELLLPVWQGHLKFDEDETYDKVTFTAVQGFRASDALMPSRAHYTYCSAPFGGLFSTVAQVAECTDCPYNLQAPGGTVGIVNPDTGLPWTFCDRRSTASCIARGVDPKFHLSHATQTATTTNNQTHGPNLLSTSAGNENNLKEPVRVVLARRRVYGMAVMAFRRDLNTNHPEQGFFAALYEGCEGPQASVSGSRITVGGVEQNAVAMHFNYRLGTRGQTSAGSDLSTHGYSGTAHIRYNFGWCDPSGEGPGSASATAVWGGLTNIRVYTDVDTYTETTTSNRVWHLARMLCDKRWGYGYDYDRLDIQSFIDAAAWAERTVTYVDPFGTSWTHVRSDSYPELIGKKVQQQIEDLCMAGRLSMPFLFNGKICVVPLKALTTDELADCPIFTDEGEDANIVVDDDGRTSVTSKKTKSDFELVNRVEITYDNQATDYQEAPLRPLEDEDAQFRAGRVLGDNSRKINNKKFALLGVVVEAQATKMGWSIMDLGPNDEGGLQNNRTVKFKTWFSYTLDLHKEKVIKVVSSKLTKYGFTYFRVKEMKRLENLEVEMTVQAYNETYMATFEGGEELDTCTIDADCDPGYVCVGGVCVPESPAACSIDSDCPPGYICQGGVCVPYLPPTCKPGFGTISYADGTLIIPIDPC
jgi:hypothetical protein